MLTVHLNVTQFVMTEYEISFFFFQKPIKTWAEENQRRINHLKNPIRTDTEDSAVFLKAKRVKKKN